MTCWVQINRLGDKIDIFKIPAFIAGAWQIIGWPYVVGEKVFYSVAELDALKESGE